MKGNLKQALENTNTVYNDLVVIADGIARDKIKPIKDVIDMAGNVKDLTDSQIRNLIVLLSMRSFSFSEAKEHAVLHAACAEALRKEAHAKAFIEADGAQGAKENKANIETADEIMTEAVYDLVAALLKGAQDECHRVVDALKTVLMSRMQEARLMAQVNADRAPIE